MKRTNIISSNPATLIFFVIFFLLSPVIAILLFTIYLWLQNAPDKSEYYTLSGLLSAWLAGMNATKIPASDQIAYEAMYKNVPNFSFWEALTKLSVDSSSVEIYPEPVYKAFCYIGYYLTFGNSYLYFALVTFVIYISVFYCIYKIFNYSGYDNRTIITGFIICAFFFQFFNETVHAIRQFLAGCIVLLAIMKKNETGKNPWLLYLLALLSHKSTILFVLFCLLPIRLVEKKNYIILITIAVAIGTYFMSQLSSAIMLLGLEDSYILRRAANDSKEFTNMNKLILYGVSVPIIYICFRALLDKQRRTYNIRYFLFICLLLSVFVISCGKNTLFMGRYFFYLYFVVPFTIPLLFERSREINYYYQMTLCLFMPVHFFTSFKTCIWQYADTLTLLLYPYPYLLNYFS